ncbi:MAG: KilA-N domain-containing protein, partial [Arsenophonus sp.]|nr:KilA-N domain-containing protein [Arsenophonus sp.]
MSNLINEHYPIIAGVEITTDSEGRFNLNALHKASGGKDAKRPKTWLETKQAQELIEELRQNSALAQEVIKVQKGGINPGTFAHELLAIEYAGWISPKFRLMVNQIFIDYRTGKLAPIDPTNLGLPNFLDPAESAIAWAAQHKKVQLLGVQVQQLETENDCLKNLFKEGMTPTQFSKMLNGVNSQQINHFLAGLKWLYN